MRPHYTCRYCGNVFTPKGTHRPGRGHVYCNRHCQNQDKFRPPEVRFWEKVEKGDGCWLWTAATNQQGYGRFSVDRVGTLWLAHHFAWVLAYGDIPDGLWVLHHCDTPACVRPDHLWLGTVTDNVRDMIAKGRAHWQQH
jgi:hypothetical protein